MASEPEEVGLGCVLLTALVFGLPFFVYLAITWLRWLAFWLGYDFPA